MAFRRKTSAWHRADFEQKKLFTAGVPERYWGAAVEQFCFVPFRSDDREISEHRQRQTLEHLLTGDGLQENAIVGIGSAPTDDLALAFASTLVKAALQQDLRVEMLDASQYLKLDDPPPLDVVLLHNVNIDSDPMRIRQARDILRCYEGSFRAVAYAGPAPREFFDHKLRYHLDSAFWLQSLARTGRYISRHRVV